jgi:hypothetical protein
VLIDFQRALADLTASVDMCRRVRAEPGLLRHGYDLTDREWRRLVAVVRSKGMEANCVLYRANRLAPVALNLPETCAALGEELTRLISSYWDSEPITNVHFLVEADRFCHFLKVQPDVPANVLSTLEREHAAIAGALAASRSRAGQSALQPAASRFDMP